MRANNNVTEITGSPAQVWGNVLIPANGKMNLKISGDVLQATHTTTLEKKESWTRIQNIDSIEIMEAPIYPLLAFGGFLCLMGLRGLFASDGFLLFILLIGIALVLIAILKKRRYKRDYEPS